MTISDIPLVCVCIPCYNNESTIEYTLQSIMEQSYKNITIKVFDNASTDSTLKKVKSFLGGDFPLEIHTRLSTVSGEENISTCILAAEGKYTGIFHSDDIYLPQMIETQVSFLEKNKQCLGVATAAAEISSQGGILGLRMIPAEIQEKYSYSLNQEQLIELSFKYGNFITCPSVLFSTNALINVVRHFDGKNFKSSADLDVWFRLTQQGSLGFINDVLMQYRLSSVSFSYNLARTRITDHDMFLVLNQAIQKYDFSREMRERLCKYKAFLLMKDRVNTNLNRLILNKGDLQPVSLLLNIPYGFKSKFHVKYFLITCIAKIIFLLPKSVFITRLIKNMKFNND